MHWNRIILNFWDIVFLLLITVGVINIECQVIVLFFFSLENWYISCYFSARFCFGMLMVWAVFSRSSLNWGIKLCCKGGGGAKYLAFSIIVCWRLLVLVFFSWLYITMSHTVCLFCLWLAFMDYYLGFVFNNINLFAVACFVGTSLCYLFY